MNKQFDVMPKIEKTKLEILRVVNFFMDEVTNDRVSVHMSDGWDYSYAPFLQGEIGDRFAVVKEMNIVFMAGSIILCEKI